MQLQVHSQGQMASSPLYRTHIHTYKHKTNAESVMIIIFMKAFCSVEGVLGIQAVCVLCRVFSNRALSIRALLFSIIRFLRLFLFGSHLGVCFACVRAYMCVCECVCASHSEMNWSALIASHPLALCHSIASHGTQGVVIVKSNVGQM